MLILPSILRPSTELIRSARIVLPEFRRVITPDEEIPQLGDIITAACPQSLGLSLYDDTINIRRLTATARLLQAGNRRFVNLDQLVIYGARFVVQPVGFVELPGVCHDQPDRQPNGSILFGYVRGHELHFPIPKRDHPAWITVYYDKHNYREPVFRNTSTGNPIFVADILYIWSEDIYDDLTDRRTTKCHMRVIVDASKL